MNDFLDCFQTADIFSLSLVSLSLAVAATLIFHLLMRIALRFSVGRMKRIAEQTTNRWPMLLAALGVDFAFPARTVYLAPGSEGGAAASEEAENSDAPHALVRPVLN